MNQLRQRTFQVGAFLAVGLLGVLLSILLLGGDRSLFQRHVYLYANMDQVQGLDRGSVISLSGMVIGNIDSIIFSKESKSLRVKMRIEQQFLPRLTKNATVDVRTQGALGDKYIYVSQPFDDGEPLHEGDFLQTRKSTDFLDMLTSKTNDAERVFDIINEVYKLTKIINSEGRSEKIMANFASASENLRLTSEEARKAVTDMRTQNSENIKQSLQHFNSILGKLDRGEGTLGALINDPTIHEKLKLFLGGDKHKEAIQSLIRTSIQKGDK